MLVVNLDGRKYGLFVGENGKYIISESDAVHAAFEKGEKATLAVGFGMRKMETGRAYTFAEIDALEVHQEFTLAELLFNSEDVPVRKFIDYWGIKPRIARNYFLLLNSMREIGASVEGMPEWGAK